jgi:hypothetical protein
MQAKSQKTCQTNAYFFNVKIKKQTDPTKATWVIHLALRIQARGARNSAVG